MAANPEEFRKHAGECHRLAALLKNPDHKALALALAATWLDLAESAGKRDIVLLVGKKDEDNNEPPSIL